LGLLFLGLAGQSKPYMPQVWNWTRAAEFQWHLRAQELGSATKDSDGRRPAALRKLSARDTTGGAIEAVGTQYDRRHYGSCRRAIRPAALLKLSARGRTSASHATNSVL
jgi:hypothetical protein